MTVRFDDNPVFAVGASVTTLAYQNLSCSTQLTSLTGASFAGYSTNGGAPVRLLTDSSTLNQVISYLKTLTHDLLQSK